MRKIWPSVNLKLVGLDTDAIAVKTGWTPLDDDASNFRATELKKVNTNHVQIIPSSSLVALSVALVAGGAGLLLVWFLGMAKTRLYFPITGAIFLAGGVHQIFVGKNYIALRYLGGKWTLSKRSLFRSGPPLQPSSRIYAIQLLGKHVEDRKKAYDAYELNIVYENGARENILNQPDYSATLEDAINLSKILGVPLWNGVVKAPDAAQLQPGT